MRIFIPHSSRDRAFALQLEAALTQANFNPWLYERSIESQSNWVAAINQGLKEADLALLLWSQAAANSYATQLEWTASLAREIADRRRRLAVILLDTHPIEPVLAPKQHIDASRDPALAIRQTIDWLKDLTGLRRMTGGNAPVHLPDYHPGTFIGRQAQLATLRTALADQVGEMLIGGEPGGGKSTLALEFAWQTQKDFDAVVFQACGQRPLAVIAGELADTLKEQLGDGVTQLPPEQKLKAALHWLKQRRTLLVLDNVTPDIKPLVPGPPVSVLHTSRRHSLPWLATNRVIHLDPFTPEEAESVFRAYLEPAVVDRHKPALLDFAARMQWLPIAVTVGAALLRDQYGPIDKAARKLMLDRLTDVTALLDQAIEAQDEAAQNLLRAAAVCAPENFWLPLAADIARLDESTAENARDNLVNASLLRLIDADRQRFQLHALLRERLRANPSRVAKLRAAHSAALAAFFTDWETRWQGCRECIEEIIPAVQFQWDCVNRNSTLSFNAFSLAKRIGEMDAALRIMQHQECLWSGGTSHQYRDGLQASYGNQALILRAWGRLEEALALHKQQEAICIELGNQDGLHACLGNQALILQAWGRLEEALALHKKVEAIYLELGNKDGLQASYGNQALILKAWGRLEEALALHKQQEAICRELGNQDGLQASNGNQALILKAWGRLEEALALHKQEEAICRELGNQDGLQACLGNQATILKAWGRLEEALALHKQKEAICIELGNKNSLQISYGNQAVILLAWGRLEEALSLLQKKEAICRDLNNKEGLAYCYANWGLLASAQKDPATARDKLSASLALFTELGMPRHVAAVQQALESL